MEEILNEVVTQDELEVRIVLKTNTVVIIFNWSIYIRNSRKNTHTNWSWMGKSLWKLNSSMPFV